MVVYLKKLIIYRPMFLNPFCMFSFFWIVVLILYPFSKSQLNTSINGTLLFLLLIFIFISLVLAKKINRKLKNKSLFIDLTPRLVNNGCLLLLLMLYIVEFCYSGFLPILVSNYKGFGIPTVHVGIVCLSILFYFNNFIMLLATRKMNYFIKIVIVLFYFLLIMSRGTILFLIFCSLMIILATFKYKITIKKVILLILFAVLGLYFFGILGNIRSGAQHWTDTSYFMWVCKIDGKNSFLSPFLWAYEYLICSYRNLIYNFSIESSYDVLALINNFLPDFISKRLISIDTSAYLIQPALTTGTAFLLSYVSFGLLGFILMILEYFFISFIISVIECKNSKYWLICDTLMCYIMALSIFDNMLFLAGYTVTLICSFVLSQIKFEKYKIKIINRDNLKIKVDN